MVEEDLERDDDDEYLSDMVILCDTYDHYRSIKVEISLSIALEMRSTLKSRRRERKISCRPTFTKDNVISYTLLIIFIELEK
jgi:hypothetical protein